LDGFGYSLEYIFQDLKLQFLSKFKLTVPERKAENSPKYPTEALLIQDRNLTRYEFKLLQSFVSQHPQTTILFWGGDPVFRETLILCRLLVKLCSLEYLCISNGHLNINWPRFFNQFKRLKLVYFTPNELCYTEKRYVDHIDITQS
jgi:hypothetical protein